jgi:hypothetical protein
MSQRKAKLMRTVAKRFKLNLGAIKRDYKSVSHRGKAMLSEYLAGVLKEADARNA